MKKHFAFCILFFSISFFSGFVPAASAAPSIASTTLSGTEGSIVVNPTLHAVAIHLVASEAVNWMSLKIEKQDDSTAYKTFGSGAGCVDGTTSCDKSWDGPLSHGVFADGVYKIKVHIKNAANEEFFDYLSYTITADTTSPVFTPHADIIAEATSTAGAYVTFAVTAHDAVDGDVSPSCTPASDTVFALGTTTVSCSATDAHANATTTAFSIAVRDTTKPVITLSGAADMTVAKRSTFTDPGYSASDTVDGDLTSSVVVSGTVDTALTGDYTLHYDVADASGNAADTSARTVHVAEDAPPPAPHVNGSIGIFVSSSAPNPLPIAEVAPVAVPAPAAPSTSPGGEVLGAATYFFAHNLGRGMFDAEVAELQKLLVAKGYAIPDAVTTYFGPQTFAALRAFQSDNDISDTGFCGPLTREALNRSTEA